MKVKSFIVTSSVFMGLGLVSALLYKEWQDDKLARRREQWVEEIREVLSSQGEIVAFYLELEQSIPELLVGGAVLVDGRHYHFSYDGQEVYLEENDR